MKVNPEIKILTVSNSLLQDMNTNLKSILFNVEKEVHAIGCNLAQTFDISARVKESGEENPAKVTIELSRKEYDFLRQSIRDMVSIKNLKSAEEYKQDNKTKEGIFEQLCDNQD